MSANFYQSTKIIELGSCAFRQWRATTPNRANAGFNSDRCSKIHGYRLTAKFWFGCSGLDEKNWCVDFGGLVELKNILEKQFDHTTCIAESDPLLPLFKQLHEAGGCDLRVMPEVGIERVSEYCYNIASEYIKKITDGRCWVTKVEVWEHEKNSAIYEPLPEAIVTTVVKDENVTSTQGIPQGTPITLNTAPPTPPSSQNHRAAHVGPNVSTGKGDWFSGTSWGR